MKNPNKQNETNTARKSQSLEATGRLVRRTFGFLKGEHLIKASARILCKTI